MTSSPSKVFAFIIAVLFASSTVCLVPGGTHADSAATQTVPPDKGRFVMPFGLTPDDGERLLSFEDEFDDEDEFDTDSTAVRFPIDDTKAWLLDRSTFNNLSSAGRRAALRLNGKLTKARRRSVELSSSYFPEAVPGANIRVNDPALDTDFHTHSETSIAVNGNTIIVSFNEANDNGYGLSTDSGTTWSHRRTPDPPGGFNIGDGVVAFGPNGECYYAGLALLPSGSTTKSIVAVAKSNNGGATFSPPSDASTTAGNTTDFQDKEWIAVDKSNSPFKGNIYVSWTDFTSSNRFISFARSTNGGNTFEAPIAISPRDNSQVQGSIPVVAPNGDLYVAFADSHPGINGIGIVKSTDGGKTFSTTRKVATVTSPGTVTGGGGVRTNSFPSMAIDGGGNLYVVYDAFPSSLLDRSDVLYTRSTDGGVTFSTPVKLNDDATSTIQLFPSVAVAGDGTIGVKWWDRRNDALNDGLDDVYMTLSHDAGASFGKNFRVTDHNWAFGPIEVGFAGGYHGDYDGIAADGNNFYVSWSDERNGEADAFFSQVLSNRDPNLPDFNLSATKLFENVVAGDSATFDFTTGGVNGFSGPLALSASPPISGLTYSFANATVNAGSSASLTISASSGVVPGTYLIKVAGAGGGITRKSNFRLNVLSPDRFIGLPVNASRSRGFTTLQAGIKAEPNGTIHVVYDDDSTRVRGSDVFYTRSTDGGVTFSAPFKVSGTAPIAIQSTLALDASGNLYVAWTGVNPVPANGTFATFVTRSTDHGNTFSAPALASGPARDAENPQIAVDNAGRISAVYIDFSVSGTPIFSDRSTDGGTTFSTPARISQPGEAIANPPYIAVDSTGAVYVTYQDNTPPPGQIKLAIAPDGQNFSLPRVISDLQVNAFAPQLAVAKNDNLYVTFYNRFALTSTTFNREAIVVRSTDHGATFGPQINVSNNDGQSTFPSLIVGDQGRVAVVWEDTTADPQRDVFLARSTDNGTTFEPPINLSANSAVSFGAFGGMDSLGKILAAWNDDSGANTEVFVASDKGAVGPPDFTLSVNSAVISAQRSTRVEVAVKVNRFAGFNGSVSITPPDLAGLKTKKINFIPSTDGGTLSFKLKGGGVLGPQTLTFTGTDTGGRTRKTVFSLVIQPAG